MDVPRHIAPKQSRSEETFARIVDAAERLYRLRRSCEVPIRELCDEARASRSSFYARFPDIDALTLVVFERFAARTLGQQSTQFVDSHAEDLYIAGLLHDIGKIIMLENEEKRYCEVLDQAAKSGRPELDVETEVLGFNHADVGSVLAIKWFLPEDLTIAIRYHHAPGKDPFQKSLSSRSVAW